MNLIVFAVVFLIPFLLFYFAWLDEKKERTKNGFETKRCREKSC